MQTLRSLVCASVLAGATLFTAASFAAPPFVGPNVIWSRARWPEGDPFLTKQNEASIAVSSRNPRHLFGGANDYRLVPVEIAEELDEPEAWIQLYKSFDGGATWRSTPSAGVRSTSPRVTIPSEANRTPQGAEA